MRELVDDRDVDLAGVGNRCTWIDEEVSEQGELLVEDRDDDNHDQDTPGQGLYLDGKSPLRSNCILSPVGQRDEYHQYPPRPH